MSCDTRPATSFWFLGLSSESADAVEEENHFHNGGQRIIILLFNSWMQSPTTNAGLCKILEAAVGCYV